MDTVLQPRSNDLLQNTPKKIDFKQRLFDAVLVPNSHARAPIN